jgi:RNA polymerase sigma factor (sigma-70 family)
MPPSPSANLPGPAELAELMGRYCDGDRAGFRQLYESVAGRLLAYLARMTRDQALAEDLLQVTFLKVHRARAAYVRGADPMPWLYAIAHRTCLDELRKRQRGRVRFVDDCAIPAIPAAISGHREGQEPQSGAARELIEAALAALDQLSPAYRQAVLLIKLEGKSIAEAATIAGTTQGAMKVRAHRGYQKLRALLRRES